MYVSLPFKIQMTVRGNRASYHSDVDNSNSYHSQGSKTVSRDNGENDMRFKRKLLFLWIVWSAE